MHILKTMHSVYKGNRSPIVGTEIAVNDECLAFKIISWKGSKPSIGKAV